MEKLTAVNIRHPTRPPLFRLPQRPQLARGRPKLTAVNLAELARMALHEVYPLLLRRKPNKARPRRCFAPSAGLATRIASCPSAGAYSTCATRRVILPQNEMFCSPAYKHRDVADRAASSAGSARAHQVAVRTGLGAGQPAREVRSSADGAIKSCSFDPPSAAARERRNWAVNALLLQALRNRHADVGINPMTVGHQKNQPKDRPTLLSTASIRSISRCTETSDAMSSRSFGGFSGRGMKPTSRSPLWV